MIFLEKGILDAVGVKGTKVRMDAIGVMVIDQIAKGYGRKRYKLNFIKFLVSALASCDDLKG